MKPDLDPWYLKFQQVALPGPEWSDFNGNFKSFIFVFSMDYAW